MKKGLSKILIFMTLLTLMFALVSCTNFISLTDLSVPTGLTVTDNVLHWNSVNGANAYVVNRDEVDICTVSDVQYPLTGLVSGTTYVFKVKAKHTLGAYNDSKYSISYTYLYVSAEDGNGGSEDKPSEGSALLSPSDITVSNGVITWSAVDNAQSYIVSIDGKEYTALKNELSVGSLADGVYNIKVKAIGDGKNYSSSEFSKETAIDLYDGSACTTEQFGNFKDINQFESFLGYGFDVVADSIVSDRTVLTSFPIFNVDELMNLRFLKVNSKSSQVKAISEDNMESFAEQWNSALNVNVSTSVSYAKKIKVGGSVKLKDEFSVAANSAKSNYYYCITITDQKFYIVMQGDMDTYRGMLSAGFEKDLYDRNVEPSVLFQRYGTHFITSAVMGGRMNAFYNMYSLNESVSEKEYIDVSTEISAAFSGLFSVKGSIDAAISFNENIQSAKTKNSVNTKESIDVMGGADFGIASISQVPDVYADWQKSLDAYPSLMGIKDSSSLIGIWELIDIAKDTDNDWTWIDENGDEQHGTRAQQLQAYFYKYGLENYNLLMISSNLPETVKPEAIGNVLINGRGSDRDGYYSVDADSINALSFTVLPDNAAGYTKSYSLAEESKEYAYIENGELVVRPAAVIPSGTVLYLTVSAGNVQKTLRLRVIRKYNVTYNLNFTNDYVVEPTYGVLEGSMISPPILMSKTDGTEKDVPIERFGYRLTGWASYSDGEYIPYDFGKPVASSLNLFAQWQKITNIVTFDAQGGSFEGGQSSLSAVVDYNEYAESPEVAPNRDHYEFAGWVTEKNGEIPFDFDNTPILKKTTVYAKWVPVQYIVTVNYDNGAVGEKFYTSADDGFIISVTEPTKEYYDFVSWALADGTKIELNNYLFKQDTAIKAIYTPTLYTVTFNTDGGSAIEPQAVSIETNFKLGSAIHAPEKIGYTFRAWQVYVDNEYKEIDDLSVLTIKADMKVTALYNINKYTVIFETNGGSYVAPYDNVQHGMTVSMPTQPIRDGYDFVGWFKDASLEKRFSFEADTIEGNVTLYASWTEKPMFTVKFFSNIPDKAFEDITVEKGTVLSSRFTEDMNADNPGYRFDGWFTDEKFENYFNPDTPITENIVLYAKWVSLSYTIEFVDGATVLESKEYQYNEEVIAPENPEKVGHTFIGWSAEIPQYMPSNNVRIYANFAVNSYTVSYRLSEEEIYREKVFAFGEKVAFAVNAPEKVGRTFLSWDTELPEFMPANDIVITAQWSVNKYKVTFYMSSSTDVYSEIFTESEVEYGSVLSEINVGEPTVADGYAFKGWNFGGITNMPAEDIDAFAIVELVSVAVTLNYGDNTQTVTALYGTNLREIFAEVTLKDDIYLYDGNWKDGNGVIVAEDATVPSTDVTYIACSSARQATYSNAGCTVKHGFSSNTSIYLTLSDLPAFDRQVLAATCGAVTLGISFDFDKNVDFEVLSGNSSLYNRSLYTDEKYNTISVKTLISNLFFGIQLKFKQHWFGFNDIVISNVKITLTAIEGYCVNLDGKLYLFDTLDKVDGIPYTQPSNRTVTETLETSPLNITRDVTYTFVNWTVNDNVVKSVDQKFQLSPYFTNTRSIKVVSNIATSYSKYSVGTITKTSSYSATVTDDSKDVYVTFGVGNLRSVLSKYNLKLSKIDIAVYMIEKDKGYQEIFLTKGTRTGWSNFSHVFNSGDVIYSNTAIETAGTSKGEGWFYASPWVNYTGSNLPDNFYLYFGAHGDDEDNYDVSNISITLHFEAM